MLDARCAFGIHLDMNPGHAGFEFYDVAPDGKLAPLGRPLQSDWEAEGKVPDMAGLGLPARRMIRGMGHMLFPRYIQREARDFFYLTSRPILPGAPHRDRRPGRRGAGRGGVAHAGAAAARLPVRARDDVGARARGLEACSCASCAPNPRTMTPARAAARRRATRRCSRSRAPREGRRRRSGGRASVFSVGDVARRPKDATRLVAGVPGDARRPRRRRAPPSGVQDEDGMLVWVELPPDASAGRPDRRGDGRPARARSAARRGWPCRATPARCSAARSTSRGEAAVARPAAARPSRLVRAQRPTPTRLPATRPSSPSQVWQPLQAKRIRYFYKPTPQPPRRPRAAPASPQRSRGTPARRARFVVQSPR